MGIREHLEDIKRKRGALNPKLVVDAARSEDSPLHDSFEWDDTVAGEAWRREQARKIIMSVEVSYVRGDGTKSRMRQYYAVKRENVYNYETPEEISSDPISREILLSSMERDWKELENRYHDLEEFWDLVEETTKTKQIVR